MAASNAPEPDGGARVRRRLQEMAEQRRAGAPRSSGRPESDTAPARASGGMGARAWGERAAGGRGRGCACERQRRPAGEGCGAAAAGVGCPGPRAWQRRSARVSRGACRRAGPRAAAAAGGGAARAGAAGEREEKRVKLRSRQRSNRGCALGGGFNATTPAGFNADP